MPEPTVTVRMREGAERWASCPARAAAATAVPACRLDRGRRSTNLPRGCASTARWTPTPKDRAGQVGQVDAAQAHDQRFMRRAVVLAERGRHTVSPNPLVGCVLVDPADGAVVAEGWHERAGEPHAEAAALAAAGERAAGATAYVTLEPCAHRGRTPPCADALIAAGVARVVVALADPNALAAGGTPRLRAAGIAVDEGCLADEVRRQNAVFLHGLATGRPYVVAKAAVSLDGRIAAADGSSQWLTGPATRERVHALAGRGAGQPLRAAVGRSDAPVQADGGLGHDVGTPGGEAVEEHGVLPTDLIRQAALVHGDAGGSQPGGAAGGERVVVA